VKFVLDHDGRVTPFKDNRPGKYWFSAFMGRNPDMTFRKPMSLGHESAAVTLDKIEAWFKGRSRVSRERIQGRTHLFVD